MAREPLQFEGVGEAVIWWMSSAAIAASVGMGPRFVAAVPEDARVAEAAFREGEVCAGWAAPTHAEVVIARRTLPGDWLGAATRDEHGLARIELTDEPGRAAEIIVHEVAHAWIWGGPTALQEGRATLLADCISRRLGGKLPLAWDDGRSLDAMPDLREWELAGENRPESLPLVRTDAYLGASRLVRTAALIVGERAMLDAGGAMDFAQLDGLLAATGARGAGLREALAGGALAQRAGLSDEDADGLTAIGEAVLGTDAARYDSTGDGRGDGLELPEGAVALPSDGSLVCLAAGGEATREFGGVRGVGASPRFMGAPGMPLVAWLPPASARVGVGWARAVGAPLTEGCAQEAALTVVAANARYVPLVPRFVEAVGAARDRLEARYGSLSLRMGVLLGADVTDVEGGLVLVGVRELEVAAATDGLDALANEVVAAHKLRIETHASSAWSEVEAMARSIR